VDYLCILDFEATCNDGPPPKPQEIIEFPTLLLNVATGEVEDTFHHYIKPDVHPQLSPFCTDLTGIAQDIVDQGMSVEEALKLHEEWLDHHCIVNAGCEASKHEEKKRFLYVTGGDWDLKTCLPNQLVYHGKDVPQSFSSWIRTKAYGMANMLKELNLCLEGRHHSGIDDCRNLARICIKMLKDGWVPSATAGVGRVGTRQF
jgi:inhibitor of KinA sporulation pathway (predicted exonuclease)